MDSFKGSPCASAVGEKMEIRRVITEQKILMWFSPNPHTPIMFTYAQTHMDIHIYFFSPLSPIASHLISELGKLKAQPPISRVTTAQLVMRNLLCCLSTEDCSVDHLPTSILITPLTEIRKSLFLTLPFLFSLCPTGLRLPLLLISGRISPLHT